MSRIDPASRAYRTRVAAVQAEVQRRLVALYGDHIDPDAINDSMERFIEGAAPIIEAGQATVAALAEAFLERRAVDAGAELDFDELQDDVVGTTRDGSSLPVGMAAFGPLVLGQIAGGKTVDDALAFGQYLATRFGDSELTGTADRISTDPVVRDRVTGWEGIVDPASCDPCRDNEGPHELSEAIYRHPGCNCVYSPIFGSD